MTAERESNATPKTDLPPRVDFWAECTAGADEAIRRFVEQFDRSSAPEASRQGWRGALTQCLDSYMRSEAFLETMRQNLKAIVKARQVVVADTPYDVVYEEGLLKLLRYRNAHSIGCADPVLVCFALVNRPYILDLQAERSVVRQLLRRGLDVYLIDWGVPTDADRTLRLDDYVCGFLKNVVAFVCRHSNSSQINLLGYCMGGTMSTIFTALYPEAIRNLILMAAPIDFAGGDGLLHVWANEKYFDVDALVDAYGNCPGAFLQATFQMMKPVQNFVEKYTTFFEKMNDDAFLESFFAMERWGSDNIPVAGETFREFVKCLYQRNQLIRGELRLRGQSVQLEKIRCPLLLLVAEHDHLVPPDSTRAVRQYVQSSDVTELSINAGHIGLAVSSKAHRSLWPKAARWIADRSFAERSERQDDRLVLPPTAEFGI